MADNMLYATLKLAAKDYETLQSDTDVLEYGEPIIAKLPPEMTATDESSVSPPSFALKIGDGEHQFKDLNWVKSLSPSEHSGAIVIGTSRADGTKDNCDYLCDGTNDHEIINKAIANLPETGGKIILRNGEYFLGNYISIKKSLRIQGCGYATRICVAQNIRTIFRKEQTTYNIITGSEFKVSDLTICCTANNCPSFVEGTNNPDSFKQFVAENVLFSCSYSVPAALGYTPFTTSFSTDTFAGNFFYNWTTTDFAPSVTLINCILATDSNFTIVLHCATVKNLLVLGANNETSSTQKFLVYGSDVEIGSIYGRQKINIELYMGSHATLTPFCSITDKDPKNNIIS